MIKRLMIPTCVVLLLSSLSRAADPTWNCIECTNIGGKGKAVIAITVGLVPLLFGIGIVVLT